MVCGRCHVGLRSALPEENTESTTDDPATSEDRGDETSLLRMAFPRNRIGGFLVELWSGENLALHSRLREALDEAGIPYYSKPVGDYPGVHRVNPLPIAQRPRFGFTLAVLAHDLRAAREILKRLVDEEPEDMELAASDDGPRDAAKVTTHDDADATTEVWSGGDVALSSFIEASLKENGIASRRIAGQQGNLLFVHSADEVRAREIVREIVVWIAAGIIGASAWSCCSADLAGTRICPRCSRLEGRFRPFRLQTAKIYRWSSCLVVA
jgi:hypothetical protein